MNITFASFDAGQFEINFPNCPQTTQQLAVCKRNGCRLLAIDARLIVSQDESEEVSQARLAVFEGQMKDLETAVGVAERLVETEKNRPKPGPILN